MFEVLSGPYSGKMVAFGVSRFLGVEKRICAQTVKPLADGRCRIKKIGQGEEGVEEHQIQIHEGTLRVKILQEPKIFETL